jgi:hypothetical protein
MAPFKRCSSIAAAVVQFGAYLNARNYDPIPTLFASNATWHTIGDATIENDGGDVSDLATQIEVFTHAKRYQEYSFTILNQVTEDVHSIIEARVTGDYDDLHYVNNVTFAFTFDEAGKVVNVNEYDNWKEVDKVIEYFSTHPTNSVSPASDPAVPEAVYHFSDQRRRPLN